MSIETKYEEALQEAISKIKNSPIIFQYAKAIYLYGSMARNEHTPRSDIDLLLELDQEGRKDRSLRKEIIMLKGRISGEEWDDPEVDLKVVFGEEWKSSNQLYYQLIRREGKLIWKKKS